MLPRMPPSITHVGVLALDFTRLRFDFLLNLSDSEDIQTGPLQALQMTAPKLLT